MKIATTTGDFSRYNVSSIEGKIDLLYKAGFKYIDLSLCSKAESERFMKDGWEEDALNLKKYVENKGMKFVQAHSFCGEPFDADPEKAQFLVDATIRNVEVCGLLDIPFIVVHSGSKLGMSKEESLQGNIEFYSKLYPAMEKTGVKVLIENSCKPNIGEKWFFVTGEEMKEFLDLANHPLLGACWDTGHANVEGHQYSDILALGKYLDAIHFNDNNGERDQHIMPYMGTMSIDEVMTALLEIDFKGPLTFEACESCNPGASWPYARRTFEKDNRAYKPSLDIKMDTEKLLLKIGEHILNVYNIEIE